MKSNSLTVLTVNTPPGGAACSPTTPCTAVVTGKFSVQYNDALNGAQCPKFSFGNGTFQINVTDAGPGGSSDQFADAMHKPDGTIFHLSTGPFNSSNGSAAQVTLGGGNITVHP